MVQIKKHRSKNATRTMAANRWHQVEIGGLLFILPIHLCITTNEMKYYKNNTEKISRL